MNLLGKLMRIALSRSHEELIVSEFQGLLLSVFPASAYIGPSTASMIWQLMLAVLLAAGYMAHLYWWRIKGAIKKKLSRSHE